MNDAFFSFPILDSVGEWKPHPKFDGVMLYELHYETDRDWKGLLVKVEGNKALSLHRHEDEMEFHFIISGSAKARRGDECIDYLPGHIHRIPSSVYHEVVANDAGILLLSVFIKD